MDTVKAALLLLIKKCNLDNIQVSESLLYSIIHDVADAPSDKDIVDEFIVTSCDMSWSRIASAIHYMQWVRLDPHISSHLIVDRCKYYEVQNMTELPARDISIQIIYFFNKMVRLNAPKLTAKRTLSADQLEIYVKGKITQYTGSKINIINAESRTIMFSVLFVDGSDFDDNIKK